MEYGSSAFSSNYCYLHHDVPKRHDTSRSKHFDKLRDDDGWIDIAVARVGFRYRIAGGRSPAKGAHSGATRMAASTRYWRRGWIDRRFARFAGIQSSLWHGYGYMGGSAQRSGGCMGSSMALETKEHVSVVSADSYYSDPLALSSCLCVNPVTDQQTNRDTKR